MDSQSSRRVAIWVDHRETMVISFHGDEITDEEEFSSEAGPHTHGGGLAQQSP